MSKPLSAEEIFREYMKNDTLIGMASVKPYLPKHISKAMIIFAQQWVKYALEKAEQNRYEHGNLGITVEHSPNAKKSIINTVDINDIK